MKNKKFQKKHKSKGKMQLENKKNDTKIDYNS